MNEKNNNNLRQKLFQTSKQSKVKANEVWYVYATAYSMRK